MNVTNSPVSGHRFPNIPDAADIYTPTLWQFLYPYIGRVSIKADTSCISANLSCLVTSKHHSQRGMSLRRVRTLLLIPAFSPTVN
jgi:hypothetical protein